MPISKPRLGKIQSPDKARRADVRLRHFTNTAEVLKSIILPRTYKPPTIYLLPNGRLQWERERKPKDVQAGGIIKRAFPSALIESAFYRHRAQGDPDIEVVIFSVPNEDR